LKPSITLALTLILTVTGCASSGVVPVERDVFMVTKQSARGAFGSPAALLADLYAEANAFCEKRNSIVETIQEIPRDGIPFIRSADADLRFRCVAK